MDRLVAVITGGTRGIGLAIAESLAKRGASLALTYWNDDKGAESARERLKEQGDHIDPILVLKGDAGDSTVVKDHYRIIRDTLGPINVLVNNAGIMPAKSFDDITVEVWNETIRINLNSAFYWCHKVVSDMKDQAFGRIVNISSIAARGGGVVGPHYAASKAGMVGLTRYAARELGQYGITVNAIAPAFIEDAGIFTGWSEDKKAALKQKVAVPRIGNSHDVVRAFEYLLDSGFVTGVTLDVNGGAFMI